MVVITRANYPFLFKAFEVIEQNNAECLMRIRNFKVPDAWASVVIAANQQLSMLSLDHFELICFGEEQELEAFLTTKELQEARLLLEAFFANWQ